VLSDLEAQWFNVLRCSNARVPETEQVATIENGSIRWLTTPEFHTSRRTGPNSVPVFWMFSVQDIRDRVLQANFSEVRILEIERCPSQATPSIVIRADKA
jgi:hypothetical protein